jgi:hypothetical protein
MPETMTLIRKNFEPIIFACLFTFGKTIENSKILKTQEHSSGSVAGANLSSPGMPLNYIGTRTTV